MKKYEIDEDTLKEMYRFLDAYKYKLEDSIKEYSDTLTQVEIKEYKNVVKDVEKLTKKISTTLPFGVACQIENDGTIEQAIKQKVEFQRHLKQNKKVVK